MIQTQRSRIATMFRLISVGFWIWSTVIGSSHSIATAQSSCIRRLLSPNGIRSADISHTGQKAAILYHQKPTGLLALAIIDLPAGKIERSFGVPNLDPAYRTQALEFKTVIWGKDDSHVVLLINDHIKELDIVNGTVKVLAICRECRNIAFSTSNPISVARAVATSDATYGLEVGPFFQSHRMQRLVSDSSGGDLSFSPDSKHLAYTSIWNDVAPEYPIQVVNLSSREVVNTHANSLLRPSWISTTTLLVPDTASMTLFSFNVVTKQKTPFAHIDTGDPNDKWIAGAMISPNRDHILFQTYGKFPRDLFVALGACLSASKHSY